MILTLTMFLSAFVLFLSALPPSLSDGIAGFWAAASWTLHPAGPATLPLPLLLGNAAFHCIPFGSPAYRLNLAGALLTALSVPLALRLLTLARPRPAPGPALLELEEERSWAVFSFVAVTLWALSPPVARLATAGLYSSVNLFFPLLALERFLTWSRTPGSSRINGFWAVLTGGLALSLDARWAVVLPGLIALHRTIRRSLPSIYPTIPRERKTRERVLLPWVFAGAGLLVSFLTPWIILTAYQTATAEQLFRALPSILSAGLFPLSEPARAALSLRTVLQASTLIVTGAGIPFVLWGVVRALRTDRARGTALVFLWLLGGLVSALLPGRSSAGFAAAAGLILSLFLAWGTKDTLGRLPKGPLAALLLVPLALFSWFHFNFKKPVFPEVETSDLFRSLPKDSVLAWSRPETAGAGTYAQTVWGFRKDIAFLPELEPRMPLPKPGRFMFAESPELFRVPADQVIPVGFAFQPTPSDPQEPAGTDRLTLGRIPLLLAESRPPADLLQRAHVRLGEAYARLQVPDQAEEEYLAALAIRPDDGAACEALGHLFLDYGEGTRAAAAFNRAFRLEPRSESLLSDWAAAELLNGRIAKSIALLRQAIELNGNNDGLRVRLADLYEKTAQPKEAAAQWRALSDRSPRDKRFLWCLAQNEWEAGDLDPCRAAVSRYLSLDLTDGERSEANELNANLEKSIPK